jgi:tetratricopeptide (TPR) repeat protein
VAILQKTPAVRAEMVRAEQWLQSGENTAAEKAARKALFLSEGQAVWAWYVLARRDERDGADPDQINRELALAVHPPSGYQAQFAMTAYGLASRLDTLPQARTPAQGQVYYDPWFVLAARREAAGEWDDARSIYERILEDLPYDQGAQRKSRHATGRRGRAVNTGALSSPTLPCIRIILIMGSSMPHYSVGSQNTSIH